MSCHTGRERRGCGVVVGDCGSVCLWIWVLAFGFCAGAALDLSMSSSSENMRVYNRRSKTGSSSGSNKQQADTRDWANLPPKLLEKVFKSLSVADLQSAKETCRKWRAHLMGGEDHDATSLNDALDVILQQLNRMNHVKVEDIEVMLEFLIQEGLMK
ncbi:hypothetical protein KC19_8G178300 [Ceratodon purpureus]|uniref:F-box domain-containing protein n=1 Tax=Ceratodon purpureus TaxID=3225 RepID=A0A8T0H558_CERPU|nr:hypothetical protein KC19_8G178300 [Ceratodon purpureus]KAG0565278.1 hypothetical protein KC19_8G178300 [Ceratodon purpureus]